MGLHASLVAQAQQRRQLQLQQQQQQEQQQQLAGKRGRGAWNEDEDETGEKGVHSNYADKAAARAVIGCRLYAQTRYLRFELSMRCGTSGLIIFARPLE